MDGRSEEECRSLVQWFSEAMVKRLIEKIPVKKRAWYMLKMEDLVGAMDADMKRLSSGRIRADGLAQQLCIDIANRAAMVADLIDRGMP